MKIVCPCHHCEERQVGCHSKCEAYATYHRENGVRNRALKAAKAEEAEIRDYIVKSIYHKRNIKEKTHLGWNTGG